MTDDNTKAPVKLYTTAFCPYCRAAKRLLNVKEIEYEEINLGGDPHFREFLLELTGQRTVPQILIHDKPIGGYTELLALEQTGELNEMLSASEEECV